MRIQCVLWETSFIVHVTLMETVFLLWIQLEKKEKLTLDNKTFCVMISRRQQIEFHKLIMTIAQRFDLQPQQEILAHRASCTTAISVVLLLSKYCRLTTLFICPKILVLRREQITHQSMCIALQLLQKLCMLIQAPTLLAHHELALPSLEKWAHQPGSSKRQICLECSVAKCTRPTSAEAKRALQFSFG